MTNEAKHCPCQRHFIQLALIKCLLFVFKLKTFPYLIYTEEVSKPPFKELPTFHVASTQNDSPV